MKITTLLKKSLLSPTETEIIISQALKKDRSYITAFPETELSKPQIKKLSRLLERRKTQEPIPYLLGFKEFFGLKFLVNKNVLIPRPETESLVERILKFTKGNKLSVVDVGTGSGCIAITLALKNPNLKITATDISSKALEVAIKNSKLHRVENRIIFLQSNLLENVTEKIDIIAANLPYIPNTSWKKLPTEIKSFEPKLALDSGKSSTSIYQQIFKQAVKKLNSKGVIFYELDGEIIQVSADDLAEIPQE